jgi:hypothetical protein
MLNAGRARSRRRSRRLAAASLGYGAVFALCALYAYWKLFTTWQPYDDTGFNTYAIRLFMDGHTLYNQIFSPYGPFPFELWGAVFKILGVTPSTDAAYLATYVLWLATSVAIGVCAQRLSGRVAIGVCAQVLSFSLLAISTHEPILPDLLATSLLVALEAVCIFGVSRRPRAALATVGALIGVLALTKINSGGFALVAVAYAAIMSLPQLRQNAWLRGCAAAAVILIGPVLMAPDLHTGAFATFAFLLACSAVALVLAARLTPLGAAVPGEARRWVRSLLAGLIFSMVGILAVIFILGTSPRALFETVIVNGPRQRTERPFPVELARWVPVLAFAAAVAAWVVSHTAAARKAITGPSTVAALARILCGALIWFAPVEGFAVRIVLAWVAVLPSSRDRDTAAWRFVRLTVPTLAVVNSLFAYPVAGSQVQFAETMFVLCGAVCVADGLSDPKLVAALSAMLRVRLHSARAILAALTVGLALVVLVVSVALPLSGLHSKYDSYRALPFAGAQRLHLPPAVTSTLVALIAATRAHCRTLISTPGLASLNLWSGLPAPSGFTVIGLWWEAPPAEDLEKAFTEAERSPGLCEVRNNEEIRFWVNKQPLPQIPLVGFLEKNFVPIGTYGESSDPPFLYQLLKRGRVVAQPLVFSRRLSNR